MNYQQQGQSLLEALGFLMVLSVLLGSLWQQFFGQAERAQVRLEHSRSLLWQVTAESPLESRRNYTAAQALSPILQPLAQWTNLTLPLQNLRVLDDNETTAALARLHDDWSPQEHDDLSRRPAQLVPMQHLQRFGLSQVLNVFSWLPMSREFARQSLRLGWVNDEATPMPSECERTRC